MSQHFNFFNVNSPTLISLHAATMKLACLALVAMLVGCATAAEIADVLDPFTYLNQTKLGGSATWSNCGGSSDKASDIAVSFTPKDLTVGAAYSYTTSYTLSETVTGGTIKNVMSLNGIPLSSKSEDLPVAVPRNT